MKRFLLPLSVLLLMPLLVAAQEGVKYEPLILIDGLTSELQGGFAKYVSYLYGLAIAIAALLAVIKIIVAGVKYMLSSLPGGKQDAKSEITGALLGLLLILGAYVILNTINPRLLNGEIRFEKLSPRPTVFDRPDAIVISAQQTTDLTANLPSCVGRQDSGVGGTGRTTNTTINLEGCPRADWSSIATQFGRDCGTKGGTIGSSGTFLTCSIPLPPGATPDKSISKFSLSSSRYGFTSASFTNSGTSVSVNADTECGTYVRNTFGDNPSVQAGQYQQCVSAAKVQLYDYCDDNYGIYSGADRFNEKPSASCKLPIVIKTMSDFEKIFEAEKAALPANDFKGRNASFTEAEFERLCKASGGTYVDNTNLAGAGAEDRCVKY